MVNISMAIQNVFSQLPSEIRYAKISDLSKLIWSEIFAYNFQKQHYITNEMIAKDFNRSTITISRSISELVSNQFITVKYINNKRHLTIKNFNEIQKQNYQFGESNSDALKQFYSMWWTSKNE